MNRPRFHGFASVAGAALILIALTLSGCEKPAATPARSAVNAEQVKKDAVARVRPDRPADPQAVIDFAIRATVRIVPLTDEGKPAGWSGSIIDRDGMVLTNFHVAVDKQGRFPGKKREYAIFVTPDPQKPPKPRSGDLRGG